MQKKLLAVTVALPLAALAADIPDPLLTPGGICAPGQSGQPALLRTLIIAATETAPFQPVPAQPVM